MKVAEDFEGAFGWMDLDIDSLVVSSSKVWVGLEERQLGLVKLHDQTFDLAELEQLRARLGLSFEDILVLVWDYAQSCGSAGVAEMGMQEYERLVRR